MSLPPDEQITSDLLRELKRASHQRVMSYWQTMLGGTVATKAVGVDSKPSGLLH
jgi:hypothetical protein